MKEQTGARRVVSVLVRSILPVVLALIVGGIIIAMLGKNPLAFYGDIVRYGLFDENWQNSLVLMAPLLIMAVGLTVVFRAQLWNLGYDGQYLLGAVVIAGFGPTLLLTLPFGVAILVLCIGAIAIAAAWTLLPAILKAKYGTNEIITSLVMSFIGIGVANILVKGPFQDPNVVVPQTRVIPTDWMLPYIPGTRIHVGFLVAIVVAVVFQVIISRTSFGLRLDVFGASPKSARHVGINSAGMVIVLFLISGGLIGLAAAVDILGEWGYLRTNWNPSYGNAILPFVFLARLSPLACVPFIAFYSVLATGGTIAAQRSDLSVDYLLVVVALILVFMTITEYVGRKRELGQSYLPDGLKVAFRRSLAVRAARSAE